MPGQQENYPNLTTAIMRDPDTEQIVSESGTNVADGIHSLSSDNKNNGGQMTGKVYFPKLFEHGRIGNVEIGNRIVMLPTGRNFQGAMGEVTDRTIANYVERAKGGFGLIIVGSSDIGLEERSTPSLSLADDRFVEGHYYLTEAVHTHGTKIAVQLTAVGPVVPFQKGGQRAIAASDVPPVVLGERSLPRPRPLKKEEIYELMDKYAAAAWRARWAGYDIVEVHACHGYLINSFISPYMNKRKDEFGGSLENRMRFLLGIIGRIKEKAGEDFPISVRISGDEFVDGGITTKESPLIAKILEEAGVAVISVSAGIIETFHKSDDIMRLPEDWKLYIWEAVKNGVTIPTIAGGNIRTPEFAESVIAQGKADFVGLGRAPFADPEWPKKAAEGRVEDIRRCISCLECHFGAGGFPRRWAPRCTVNATWGREREFAEIKRATVPKKVMIIGGGPAGMEAARIGALRGHQVVLYEKEHELGGQLLLASKPPGKEKIAWLRDYLATQMKKLNVKVELGVKVTPALVDKDKPDVVVIATGAEPIIPDIPGINSQRVTTAVEILGGKMELGNQKVVVIGGGMVGCEVAEFLAERNNSVTILEILPTMASDMEPLNRKGLMDSLIDKGVTMMTERNVVEFSDRQVVTTDSKGSDRQFIETDWVIVAVGSKPVQTLKNVLAGKPVELYTVGDCVEPRRIMDAIYEGSLVARKI